MAIQSPKSSPTFFSRFTVHATVIKYGLIVGLCTGLIFLFSMVMASVVQTRNAVNVIRKTEISNVYRGAVVQSAPLLNKISKDTELFNEKKYDDKQLEEFIKNSGIISTKGTIDLTADFVKKGLEYEPTFKTQFEAEYMLKNTLDKEAVVSFEFPFPAEINKSEISNATLIVDGKEIRKAKSRISFQGNSIDGLKWEGKLPADGQAIIRVRYETVGISDLNYQGFENPTGAQDFMMEMTIRGTRDYNLVSGLSINKRSFGDSSVALVWDKKSLFSTPSIRVNIGKKLAPSTQVAKVYVLMTPLYLLFAGMLIWLGMRNKKQLLIRDLILTTVLFAVYFPLWHYMTSFTIDPTMEFFASWKSVPYFSLTLYHGFFGAWMLISLLIFWLYTAVYGWKHAVNTVIPTLIISLGLFPLAITVPDYSILLTIFGILALVALSIRFRLQK